MTGAELVTLAVIAKPLMEQVWAFSLGFLSSRAAGAKFVLGDPKNHDVPKQVSNAWTRAVDKAVTIYCDAPPEGVGREHLKAIKRLGDAIGDQETAERLFIKAGGALQLVPADAAAQSFKPDALAPVSEKVADFVRREAHRVCPTVDLPESFFTHIRDSLMNWVVYYYVELAIKHDDKSRHQIMWELSRESYLLLLTFRESLDQLDPKRLADAIVAELRIKAEAALKGLTPPWPELAELVKLAAYEGGREGGYAGGKEGAAAGVTDGIDRFLAELGPGGLRAIAENQELKDQVAALSAELERLRDTATESIQAEARAGNSEAKAVMAEIRASGDLGALQQYLIAESEVAQPELDAALADQVERCKQIVAIAADRNDWRIVAQWGEIGLRLAPNDQLLLVLMADLAMAYGSTSRARALLTTLRDQCVQLTSGASDDSDSSRQLSVAHNRMGDVQVAQGELPDALASYKAGMAIAEKLAARDPGNTAWQRDLSVSHSKLAAIHLSLKRTDDARTHLESGRSIMGRLVAHDPTNAQWRNDLKWFESNLREIGP